MVIVGIPGGDIGCKCLTGIIKMSSLPAFLIAGNGAGVAGVECGVGGTAATPCLSLYHYD